MALVQSGSHGIRISAVNMRAASEGVRVGQALADARAMLPTLLSRPAETHHDRIALLKLARWCGRYGPARHADGADGLWVDITGVAHLYGGEKHLLEDLCARLSRFGLTARAGLADTLGAAHALARFAPSPAIAPAGKTEAQLGALPVEALRLEPGVVLLLKRLGLKRISQLYALPRASLERRFRSKDAAAAVLSRLDQALGLTPEPRRSLAEPPALFVQRAFPDPLISADVLEAETARLAEELCVTLKARSLGARAIALSLYRADGSVAEARAGLSFPCCTPDHLIALIKEKLGALDAGFGIDVLVLSAARVERRKEQQTALASRQDDAHADPARLVDRLTNRLGPDRVSRLAPRESHIPERSEARIPALHNFARAKPLTGPRQDGPVRPPFLLATPEPIGVVAEVPEGPPARFTWRRVKHRVVRAQGPERIAPEWWRQIGAGTAKLARTRDYYRIEDETGSGYWVFREGLYGREEEETPTWFLHGLFG